MSGHVPTEWWQQGLVTPRTFGAMSQEDAVQVLWNLCGHYGDAVGLIRALEEKRATEASHTIDALLAELPA